MGQGLLHSPEQSQENNVQEENYSDGLFELAGIKRGRASWLAFPSDALQTPADVPGACFLDLNLKRRVLLEGCVNSKRFPHGSRA
jgi:hypothetical protein